MKFKTALFPVAIALALGGSSFLTGCDSQKANQQLPKTSSVNVTIFETKPLDYKVKIALPARVIASQIAEIRPQVSGIILKKEFDESSNVTEGQSLYQIDSAIYQATYDSALASVASAEASANIAHLTLKRYEGLLKTKSISQQDYDKASADVQQADAAVLVAKANLHAAKVNLDYTKVYSPIDGYIGKSNVTEGALVSAGQQTAMALVQKLDPIYVDMTQAASIFERNEKDRNNVYTPSEKVEIFYNDGSKYEHSGVIKFTDKTVNQTTGTITLRAEFPNPESKILPGMFVKPVWTIGHIKNAIILPQKAVNIDMTGNYSAIVVVTVPKDKEIELISNSIANIVPNMTEPQIAEAKKQAEQEAVAIINEKNSNDKIEDKQFYYLEKRNNIKVYSGVIGYWVVTEGINEGDKVITSGLIDLAGKNLNDPVKKVFVNITNPTPEILSQDQLDKIIENNIK